MSRVRSKNTKPEMIVRRMVHALGYRYRLHVRNLPGTPDLAFPRRRKIINVSGCFWHMHGCSRSTMPTARREWWAAAKLGGNKLRDKRNLRALKRIGWNSLTLWECEISDAKILKLLPQRIVNFLESAELGRERSSSRMTAKLKNHP